MTDTPLDRQPPGQTTPWETLPGQTPPWTDTPLADTPWPDTTPGQTPPSPRWLLQWTVCILLECILVSYACSYFQILHIHT